MQLLLQIHDPDFLLKNEKEWPVNIVDSGTVSDDDPEVKGKGKATVNTVAIKDAPNAMNTDINKDAKVETNQLITYFYSWKRFKISVALFLQVRKILQLCQKRKEIQASVSSSGLDAGQQKKKNEVEKEMQRFRATLRGHTLSLGDTDTHRKCHHHQYCQLDKFSDEITALKRGTSVEKSSHIYRLDPVLERGLLGVGGRLSKATMPDMALNTQSFLRKISTSPFSFYTAFMSNQDIAEEITNFPVFVNTN